jgi:cyclic pyranopterin monophosphate synthase
MELTHLDEKGRARMVDVGEKPDTDRIAIAKGRAVMLPATLKLIQEGGIPKGDVLAVARVAGIMGAKRTPDLIPMCHPLLLTNVSLDLEPHFSANGEEGYIDITATVKTTGKTGVEMEALTAVSVAALTIYDMCKAVDRAMRLEHIRLVRKSGGKSGEIILE